MCSEEKERINVWTAYMNTEFLFGTQAAVDALYTRAMQCEDQVVVQHRTIEMYVRAGKIDVRHTRSLEFY